MTNDLYPHLAGLRPVKLAGDMRNTPPLGPTWDGRTETLCEARTLRGITAGQLASALGVNESTFRAWERRGKALDAATVAKIRCLLESPGDLPPAKKPGRPKTLEGARKPAGSHPKSKAVEGLSAPARKRALDLVRVLRKTHSDPLLNALEALLR